MKTIFRSYLTFLSQKTYILILFKGSHTLKLPHTKIPHPKQVIHKYKVIYQHNIYDENTDTS